MAAFAIPLELLTRTYMIILHDAQELADSMTSIRGTFSIIAVELGRKHALLVLRWQVLGELHFCRSDACELCKL